MDYRQQLIDILPSVRHPSRYIGHEWNRILKDPASVDLSIALAFPDAYEIGMSYPGFQILYHILNRRRDVCCERVYAPFPDMEKALRDKQLSLFSLENFRPLHEFDIIGFTLQYELHATNLLTMLDLAGIPLWAKDRTDDHPLIIAGGPCVFNPEPLAPFLDAVLLGDGEEAINDILDVIIDSKQKKLSKKQLLKSLTKLPGIYVPEFYQPEYQNGTFVGISADTGVPLPVIATYTKHLREDYYPPAPLVPLADVSHNRLQVEIMRGCTRGCRFCQAGTIYRPLRERAIDSICRQTAQSLDSTGYDELSLVSLSTSDYGNLNDLLTELDGILLSRKVSLSFPSLRPDTFTPAMAKRASTGRTGGITFAPEAGTARLRAVINKAGDEDDLYRACTIALDHGWRKIKLYFMIGLPTETNEDLIGICDMVTGIFRLPGSHRLQQLTLSISPYVPKAQSPFQRFPQITGEELFRKIGFLKSHLHKKKVKLDWRDPNVAEIEGIIARGDRRMANVIFSAWQKGARFCGWSDYFRYDLYQEALKLESLTPDIFQNGIHSGYPLPWEHLSKGFNPGFFEKEIQKSIEAELTPDCRNKCQNCGLPPQDCFSIYPEESFGSEKKQTAIPEIIAVSPNYDDRIVVRIKYAVRGLLRFLSHLETVQIWERTLRRSRLPVHFTEGYHCRPRIAFSPPRPVGVASEAEYLDIRLDPIDLEQIHLNLSAILPDNLEILGLTELLPEAESLDKSIGYWEYFVKLNRPVPDLQIRCQELLNRNSIVVSRTKKKTHRESGKQLLDIRPSLSEITADPQEMRVSITKPGPLATVFEILSLLDLENHSPDIVRTGQWIIENNEKIDPLFICAPTNSTL